MLDIGMLKAIVLALKILFYSSGLTQGSIDMLDGGRYTATVSYKTSGKTMEIYTNSAKLMSVDTIDNGLYRVSFRDERNFKVDLAEFFTEIDFKKLRTIDKTVQSKDLGNVSFISSKNNLYIQYGRRVFIIKQEQLLKKK